MTPERWERIGELFAGALRIDRNGREVWLHGVCGADDRLRAEVARLLDQDARADQDGFLPPPELSIMRVQATVSWPAHDDRPSGVVESFANPGALPVEGRPVTQQKLRDLTVVFLLIAFMMLIYKYYFMNDLDRTQAIPYTIVLAILLGLASWLSSPRVLSPALLMTLELVLIGMIAAIFAFTQYQAMLYFLLLGDPARALIVVKNRVIITAVLILSYGNYAPGSWRRAAMVVWPLAILPFLTMLVLHLRHPVATEPLVHGAPHAATSLAPLGFDAMLLLILAAGSTFGARMISRLRRQVMEARQLDQYHLKRRLGAGGMGVVYLAEHQLLKRPCALKLIRPGVESNPKTLERFEREVRLTATLSHPNTIEIYDYGRTEDGTYYYVMEYLPGLNLAELVERHGPLPPGRAVYLLRQVCGALRESHAAGLIHRDIKPSNIFAARRGGVDDVAKLLDFGLVLPVAKLDAPHMSGEGHVLGTPLFMSPEQAKGGVELDGRSDIYSLGAVAYMLLTGRPPFNEDNGIRLLIAHARDPVMPPSLVCNDIPRDLERVVLRCLAKDAADRFPDAESLERALGECACAADWDQDRANQWWRAADRDSETRQSAARPCTTSSEAPPSSTRG